LGDLFVSRSARTVVFVTESALEDRDPVSIGSLARFEVFESPPTDPPAALFRGEDFSADGGFRLIDASDFIFFVFSGTFKGDALVRFDCFLDGDAAGDFSGLLYRAGRTCSLLELRLGVVFLDAGDFDCGPAAPLFGRLSELGLHEGQNHF
jgi:hypothetical protein